MGRLNDEECDLLGLSPDEPLKVVFLDFDPA